MPKYMCPECNQSGSLTIHRRVWASVTADGSALIDETLLEANTVAAAPSMYCAACDFEGTVKEFSKPEKDAEAYDEAIKQIRKAVTYLENDIVGNGNLILITNEERKHLQRIANRIQLMLTPRA